MGSRDIGPCSAAEAILASDAARDSFPPVRAGGDAEGRRPQDRTPGRAGGGAPGARPSVPAAERPDRASSRAGADAREGEVQTFAVRIDAHLPPGRADLPYRIRAADETGFMFLNWFKGHGPHLQRQHPVGAERAASGKVSVFNVERAIVHPDYLVPLARIRRHPAPRDRLSHHRRPLAPHPSQAGAGGPGAGAGLAGMAGPRVARPPGLDALDRGHAAAARAAFGGGPFPRRPAPPPPRLRRAFGAPVGDGAAQVGGADRARGPDHRARPGGAAGARPALRPHRRAGAQPGGDPGRPAGRAAHVPHRSGRRRFRQDGAGDAGDGRCGGGGPPIRPDGADGNPGAPALRDHRRGA